MATMERHFQVAVPMAIANAQWLRFRTEAGDGIEARFEPALGDETRVRLVSDSNGMENARLEQVAEAFRHFVLQS